MWDSLDAEEIAQAIAQLEQEKLGIESGETSFVDDEFTSALEKRQIELADNREEIEALRALQRGHRLDRDKRSGVAENPVVVLYPEISDTRALKKLLLIFDGVDLVMPYIKSEDVEPDLIETERAVATSIWCPTDDQTVEEIEALRELGLVRLISPDENIRGNLDSLFDRIYESAVRSKLATFDSVQRAAYVNSDAWESQIRLLECTTLTSIQGGMAVTGNAGSYVDAVGLQSAGWGAVDDLQLHDPLRRSDFVATYAGLNVLANMGVDEGLSIGEVVEFNANPGRSKLLKTLHELADHAERASSPEELGEVATDIAQEVLAAVNRVSKRRAIHRVVESALPLATGLLLGSTPLWGVVGIPLLGGVAAAGLAGAVINIFDKNRGSEISAANYLAQLE